jgi:hypothetical protein
LDLGSSPPSNSYLTADDLHHREGYFPLRVLVCQNCWLVQTEDFVDADEMFSADYAYFSNFSKSWLEHCRIYCDKSISQFSLTGASRFVEIASNDGSLLDFFHTKGIPSTGIEPTASTAHASRKLGHDVVEDFFSPQLARILVEQGKAADLIAANNVLAHVPNVNDFIGAFAILLKSTGVITFEFPYVLNLVRDIQFDTIYHEHFSYLSLTSVTEMLQSQGLVVFDVEKIPTHGGSLRVYAQHLASAPHAITDAVKDMIESEHIDGLNTPEFYFGFSDRVNLLKNEFLSFLLESKLHKKKVVGYGAAAKGNTLLNFAGIKQDLMKFVEDRNPYKQGKFLPGSHIPVYDESYLMTEKPDFIVIFPWNLSEEIIAQLNYARSWGCKFVTAIPKLNIS